MTRRSLVVAQHHLHHPDEVTIGCKISEASFREPHLDQINGRQSLVEGDPGSRAAASATDRATATSLSVVPPS
jgi:hypothetical protein